MLLARVLLQQHTEACLESGGRGSHGCSNDEAASPHGPLDAAPESANASQPHNGSSAAVQAAAAGPWGFKAGPSEEQAAGMEQRQDPKPETTSLPSSTVLGVQARQASAACMQSEQALAGGCRSQAQQPRQAKLDGRAVLKPLPARVASSAAAGRGTTQVADPRSGASNTRPRPPAEAAEKAATPGCGIAASQPTANPDEANAFAAMMTAQRELSQVVCPLNGA